MEIYERILELIRALFDKLAELLATINFDFPGKGGDATEKE